MVKDTHATTSDYGLTKLSTANDVTDPNAFALSAVEKNASIDGTLANVSRKISNGLKQIKIFEIELAGWYRILYSKETCPGINNFMESCFITIHRQYRTAPEEYHFMKFFNGYGTHNFTNLSSYSNKHYITKIRCGHNSTTNKFFVDIYYTVTALNPLIITTTDNVYENLDINTTAEMVGESSSDETYSNEFEIAGNI